MPLRKFLYYLLFLAPVELVSCFEANGSIEVATQQIYFFSPLRRKAQEQSVKDSVYVDQESDSSNSEELPSDLPLLPVSREEWETNVQAVVAFLFRIEHGTNWPANHKSIDPLKLQKLLYYAQGYSLAIYGKPLFSSAHLLKWQHGPVVKPVYDLFAGRSDTISEEETRTTFAAYQNSNLSTSQRRVLEIVSHMKSEWSGVSLSSATHGEEPYLSAKKDATISLISLRAYFQKVVPWTEFMITQLLWTEDIKERTQLIDYMRSYISFHCTEDDLLTLHDAFSANNALVERCNAFESGLGQQAVSWKYARWAHQETGFQTLMGHLFFPVQFELCFETDQLLCLRPRIQKMLALSAAHSNPLAQQLLRIPLELYSTYLRGNDEEAESTSTILPRAVEQILEEISSREEGTSPYLFSALLCQSRSDHKAGDENLKKATELGDVEAMRRYIAACCPKDQIENNLKIVERHHKGYALLLKADLTMNSAQQEERIALYNQAGKEGVATGYANAGSLSKTLGDHQRAYTYYLLAARNNIISCYDKCADLLQQQNRIAEAIDIYKEKGQKGDPEGYCQAGELLRAVEPHEAEKLFLLGGIHGYPYLIRNSQNSAQVVQKISKEYRAAIEHRLRSLLTISRLQFE